MSDPTSPSGPPPERLPRTGDLIRPPQRESDSRRKKERRTPKTEKPAGLGKILWLIVLTSVAFGAIFISDVLWTEYDLVDRSGFKSLEHWSEAWTPENIRNNDPVSLSSYFWETALPFPASQTHRAINLILHILAALVLLKTLEALKAPAAFATSLVFALHPAVLQVVFWPGYRSEILGLLLVLTALYFGVRNRNGRDYAVTLTLTALAALLHPAALAVPLILALIILFQEKHFHLQAYNRILPLVCLCLFLGVWITTGSTTTNADLSWTALINRSGQNLIFFLGQAILPVSEQLFYPLGKNTATETGTSMNLLPFLLFVPFFVLITFNIKTKWARAILLGLCSYLFLILYGVAQPGQFLDGSPAHENFGQYLALPALLALIIGGVRTLMAKMGGGGTALWTIGFSVFILIQISVTATFSYHTGEPIHMWQQMPEHWPNSWIPKTALVDHLENDEQGQFSNSELIQLLNDILQQKPELAERRLQLARLFVTEGQIMNATREYKRILRETTPSNEVLEEAARFYDRAGLTWEASNARERIR